MKLLSFAVPCYNSAAYMEHCVETLLHGGEDVEIIIVDDGSQKDNTAEIDLQQSILLLLRQFIRKMVDTVRLLILVLKMLLVVTSR